MTTTQLPLPTELPTTTTSVAGDYSTYTAAQQAVDYLSDHGFPMQHATIVGVDLRLVETVTGRRDFASHRRLAAARYHLTVGSDHADEADRLLAQHVEVMQYTWYPR